VARISVDAVSTVDVEIDLDQFDTDDLIEELRDRGVHDFDVDSLDSGDLIFELEKRGYSILKKDTLSDRVAADPISKDELFEVVRLIDAQLPRTGSRLHLLRDKLMRYV
jgi:acyl carrier protein